MRHEVNGAVRVPERTSRVRFFDFDGGYGCSRASTKSTSFRPFPPPMNLEVLLFWTALATLS